MKPIQTLLLTFAISTFAFYSVQAQPRQVINLDFGWRFHAGEVENASELMYDDSQWRTLDLPHDFQIEQPWVVPAADEKADDSDAAANIKSH